MHAAGCLYATLNALRLLRRALIFYNILSRSCCCVWRKRLLPPSMTVLVRMAFLLLSALAACVLVMPAVLFWCSWIVACQRGQFLSPVLGSARDGRMDIACTHVGSAYQMGLVVPAAVTRGRFFCGGAFAFAFGCFAGHGAFSSPFRKPGWWLPACYCPATAVTSPPLPAATDGLPVVWPRPGCSRCPTLPALFPTVRCAPAPRRSTATDAWATFVRMLSSCGAGCGLVAGRLWLTF